ncbi:DUF3343 domain-containing protein [Peptacetobacter hominis]|uniref:DUF3343 domain-containing protein n=1 Tax=Peptacetobacter hominis TaxID=2743610 RepID=A0A544QV83_9FIRM|nr:DUF3343 domain-containing protein [Peptacetobacter hominis]TQQ84592.1 DUF3343 domain-containing protein [Peptacetobacter hominis]
MKEIQTYILFNNHESGMKLKKELSDAGIKSTISPTPRQASKCCGISLIIDEKDIDAVNSIIEDKKIEILKIQQIEIERNPNRDRYC